VNAAVATHVVAAPLARSRLMRAAAVLRRLAYSAIRWRFRCLLLGHEDAFVRQPRRLQLRCAVCGRETVGWVIGPGAPVPSVNTRRATAIGPTAAVASARLLQPRAPWWARREERDRQRLRMVVAAERAASHPADGRSPDEASSPARVQLSLRR
jgi:hypothetical protein